MIPSDPPQPQVDPVALAAPAKRRWTHYLITLAVAAMALDLVAALAAVASGWSTRLSIFLGAFLLSFAFLKIGVAADSLLRMRANAQPSPVAWHGSANMAWGYIAYKFLAGAVAIAAAIYLFTAGSEAVDGFIHR